MIFIKQQVSSTNSSSRRINNKSSSISIGSKNWIRSTAEEKNRQRRDYICKQSSI